MLDTNLMRAVGTLLARQARTRAKEPDTAANEVIDLTPLLKPWQPGSYEVGDVVAFGGQPRRCVQGHNSSDNPGWSPTGAPALWAPYHATDRAHALPWVPPTGAHDAYQVAEYMIWSDGAVYRCKVDATVHGPDILSTAWERDADA